MALGVLALIAVTTLLVVYSATRSHERSTKVAIADSSQTGVKGLRATSVSRWVDAGLLTEEQATAIEHFEKQRQLDSKSPSVPPAIEALAYVGGVLFAVGAGMLVSRIWDDLGDALHLGIIGVAAVGTGVVGAIVGEKESVTRRLRGILWALSSAGFGAFAGVFVFDVLNRTGKPVALATATTLAIASAIYWMLRDRPLQHVITFTAFVVAIAVGISWINSANPFLWIGLALWVIGALWAAAAWRRWVPPEMIGFAMGAILTLIGAGLTGNRFDWLAPLLGLATAIAWTTIGISTNEVLALAPGVIGIFVYLPWTLGQFFGESLGAPVIIMLSGALLLGIVAFLWRRRSHDAQIGDLWSGHFTSVTPH